MKSPRCALITTAEPSTWASCRAITPNLERAYRVWLGTEALAFHMRRNMKEYDFWRLARDIQRAKPDRLVFLDHRPNPAMLLQALSAVYAPRKMPPIVVHLYGDFSLDAKDWVETERDLKGNSIRFVAASHRQREFVGRALLEGTSLVDVCPFPVDDKVFGPDAPARERLRQSHGVGPDEIIIGYAGRISLQKNVEQILDEFTRFAQETSAPVRLWFAGPFDDMGAPFFGIKSPVGWCYQSWHRKLMSLPQEVRKRVQYLGSLSSGELREFYNASDLYFSLSLHHDEDFGMAPAEALCCGTPAVLTDWGGFASFRLGAEEADPHCRLVPVHLDANGLRFSSRDIQRALRDVRQTPVSVRIARAKLYADKFSIQAASRIVPAIHARPKSAFTGFHWRFKELARAIGRAKPYPEGPRRGTFYEEIYGSYLKVGQLASLAR